MKKRIKTNLHFLVLFHSTSLLVFVDDLDEDRLVLAVGDKGVLEELGGRLALLRVLAETERDEITKLL